MWLDVLLSTRRAVLFAALALSTADQWRGEHCLDSIVAHWCSPSRAAKSVPSDRQHWNIVCKGMASSCVCVNVLYMLLLSYVQVVTVLCGEDVPSMRAGRGRRDAEPCRHNTKKLS